MRGRKEGIVTTVAIFVCTAFAYSAFGWPTVYPIGTTIYKPDKCYNGYNLVFYRQHIPRLIDMNGNVVHTWKNVNGIGRMRLLKNGNLLVISRKGASQVSLPPGQEEPELVAMGKKASVQEFDWEGRLVWEYVPPGRPHHDIQRLDNGNTLIIYAEQVPNKYKEKITDPARKYLRIISDCILEIDKNGKKVWEWHEYEHLDINTYSSTDKLFDWTHTNTIQVLPENKWYASGDERFKPGNILISVRNQNTIYIISRETKEVVWRYTGDYNGGLAHQHEPHMIGPGLPGAGNILIFDNGIGCRNITHEGESYVLEINPVTKKIVWKYENGERFFSTTAGVEQRLPNGNTMITSSVGNRVFEVTPSREIVWEWVSSSNPVRPIRYPYDYCPQLKALGKPKEISVYPTFKGKLSTKKPEVTSKVTSKTTKEGSRLIIVANDASYELAKGIVEFIEGRGVPVLHITASKFDNYKKERYMIVLGGPNESNGIGNITKQLLSQEEQGWVSKVGNKKMYLKADKWTKGQYILVFAGYDRNATYRALVNSKDKWWAYVSSWFDIELSHEELYGY